MEFTLFRRWGVLIHSLLAKPENCVVGWVILTKEEYQDKDFTDTLYARIYDLKHIIMRRAAQKWNRPPGA